ncbi:MAG: cobalt transporter [Ruminococcaceae bacterium]|nr:cobalt transporter [Oscillospiraceae bacterium]
MRFQVFYHHEHSAQNDPMQETLALMKYMVNHNASHARELAELADKLAKLGNLDAAQQVRTAVAEFEQGNLRLTAVMESLR